MAIPTANKTVFSHKTFCHGKNTTADGVRKPPGNIQEMFCENTDGHDAVSKPRDVKQLHNARALKRKNFGYQEMRSVTPTSLHMKRDSSTISPHTQIYVLLRRSGNDRRNVNRHETWTARIPYELRHMPPFPKHNASYKSNRRHSTVKSFLMCLFIAFAKCPILEAHILNVTSVSAHSTLNALEYIKIHFLFVLIIGEYYIGQTGDKLRTRRNTHAQQIRDPSVR